MTIKKILEKLANESFYDGYEAGGVEYGDDGYIPEVDKALTEIAKLIEDEVITTNKPYEYLDNRAEVKRNIKREVRNQLRQTQRNNLKRILQ